MREWPGATPDEDVLPQRDVSERRCERYVRRWRLRFRRRLLPLVSQRYHREFYDQPIQLVEIPIRVCLFGVSTNAEEVEDAHGHGYALSRAMPFMSSTSRPASL